MKMDIFKMSKIRKPKIVLKNAIQKCPCDENAHNMGVFNVAMCDDNFCIFFHQKFQVFFDFQIWKFRN